MYICVLVRYVHVSTKHYRVVKFLCLTYCKIPVSYICMYTKNIDPSVSHTVNLCKIFNFDFLDVQFVKGLWSCNFEDTVSYNLLMMLVGP